MEDLKQWYAKLNAKAGTAYHKPTDPQASAIPHPNEQLDPTAAASTDGQAQPKRAPRGKKIKAADLTADFLMKEDGFPKMLQTIQKVKFKNKQDPHSVSTDLEQMLKHFHGWIAGFYGARSTLTEFYRTIELRSQSIVATQEMEKKWHQPCRFMMNQPDKYKELLELEKYFQIYRMTTIFMRFDA